MWTLRNRHLIVAYVFNTHRAVSVYCLVCHSLRGLRSLSADSARTSSTRTCSRASARFPPMHWRAPSNRKPRKALLRPQSNSRASGNCQSDRRRPPRMARSARLSQSRRAQMGDGHEFAGLVEFKGKISVAAAVKTGAAGPFYIASSALRSIHLPGWPAADRTSALPQSILRAEFNERANSRRRSAHGRVFGTRRTNRQPPSHARCAIELV